MVFLISNALAEDTSRALSAAISANHATETLQAERLHEITFNVNGISLQLVMQPSHVSNQTRFYINDEVTRPTGWQAPIALQGSVTGDPDSWARLLQIDDGVYMGQIQAFGQLYEAVPNIADDSANKLQNDFQHDLPKTRLTTLPELSEQYRQLNDKIQSNGRQKNNLNAIDYLLHPPVRKTIDNLQTRNSINDLRNLTGVNVPRALRIGIVVDSQFNEFHNGMGVERALALINIVDGIYQQQLGVALILESVITYTNPQTDPIRTIDGTIESKLTQFGRIRQQETGLSRDLTLVHLFSGAPDANGVLGLGWIDTACRTDGFDVSLSTPFAFDALLAAHEMAHNLGAGHDNSTACIADSSRLMWPRLSSRTQPLFSACSLDDIAPSLAASCNLDNIDLSIAVQRLVNPNPGEVTLRVEIDNLDPTRSTNGARALITLPGASLLSTTPRNCRPANAEDIGATLSQNQTQLICLTGNIPARSRVGFELGVRSLRSPVQQWVSAQVAGLASADTQPQNNRVLVDIGVAGLTTLSNDASNPAAVAAMSPQSSSAEANNGSTSATGLPMVANATTGSASAITLISLLSLLLLRALLSTAFAIKESRLCSKNPCDRRHRVYRQP